jgi:hypothetical protein
MVLDINQAKRLFQGRQALKHLFNQAKKYLSIQHLNYDIFIGKMLLPEIEKNINSAILHDIGLMLNVYFQQAANLTEIEYITGKSIETYLESDNYSILGYQNKIISNFNIMKRNIIMDNDIRLYRNQTQKGGSIIPAIVEEKNNPFTSNDMKDVNKIRSKC